MKKKLVLSLMVGGCLALTGCGCWGWGGCDATDQYVGIQGYCGTGMLDAVKDFLNLC